MSANAFDTSRNVFRAVCLLGALAVAGLNVHAAPVYYPDTDHFYDRVDALPDAGYSWTAARIAAESMSYLGVQGHLATITSQQENEFIFASLGLPETGLVRYWLGGYQEPDAPEPGGEWQWVTGEQWDYTNWDVVEPDNSGHFENEDALVGWYVTTWNDFDVNNSAGHEYRPQVWIENGFVVEYPVPEPATLCVLALGGLMVLKRRRR